MEAIVLGVKNGRAALLLDDGTTAYRRMECKPGQRVEVPADVGMMPSAARTARAAAVAAAFAIVVSGGTLYETAMPVSYVTEDVNPSMEYSLNRMDRVIGVSALNEDAEAIVDDLVVSGRTIQTAVGAAGERLEAAGKLDEDDYILFSVTSDSDQRAEKLENELADMMGGQEDEGLTFSVLRVSEDEHRAAKKLDMSAGRYKEMLDAKGKSAAGNAKWVSEYQNKSVREMLGGETEEENADAVKSEDGKNATKQNAKKSKKKNKETDSSASEVKQATETEEKSETKQVQPASRPSAPAQAQPTNPPASNPQPAEPAQQPQPQQDNGGGNDAPAVESQPAEAPQEVKKEEKQKDNADKAETKKEASSSDKAEKEAEPPSDDFEPDDGPSGGGEPGGGDPGGGGGLGGPP